MVLDGPVLMTVLYGLVLNEALTRRKGKTMTTAVCDPTKNVTRSLLGYGVLAGPFYVVVSLIQAFTRAGFDLTRHAWSLLANGGPGWIHTVNLLLSGLMVIAGAAGMRRMGLKWGPLLLAGYGVG